MKKLSSLALACALALSFGCKKEEAASKPADKPAEAKPAEVKPAEAKPAEVKPAEEKPAEAAPAAEATGIAECDAWVATAANFSKCDKIDAAAKDGMIKGLEAAKAGWAALKDPAVPADAKKAAADTCKKSEEAMKAAWTAAGCQ